jgi:AraC-like DNA-binding protein
MITLAIVVAACRDIPGLIKSSGNWEWRMKNRWGVHHTLRDGERHPAGIIQGSFGRVTVGPLARALVPHVHAEYNLLVRLDGPDSLFVSDKRPLLLADGVTLAFNPWQPHRKELGAQGPSLLMALLINQEWLSRIGHRPPVRPGGIFSTALVPHTDNVRQRARALAEAVTGAVTEAEGVYDELVADFMRATIEADTPGGHRKHQPAIDARIRRATRILRSRAHENPNLEGIASEVGMSRSRFFEQFKLTVGASPQQYLDWARMALATDALVNRSGKLHELAHDLGFGELTHFTRFIRQHLGLSPGEFRRRTYLLPSPEQDVRPD